MRKLIYLLALAVVTPAPATAANLTSNAAQRVAEAATVLREIHAVPDKDIPQELWDRASCVIVIPSLKKAAFIFGGEYGKGLMSCRKGDGWSAPIFMEMEKGSWGFQIGAESVDLVMLVMNSHGVDKLLKNKVSLGGDASVAGGPVGRTAHASTDAEFKAEILSYSRAQGLFAGIDVAGGVLKPDTDDNQDLYGKRTVQEVVSGGAVKPSRETQAFMDALRRP